MILHKPITLIIADDHEIYRDGLISAFANMGAYEIAATASDGEQLVRLCCKHKPDMILTDLRMPVVSGVEAIRHIHELQPEVRCLALSTFDNEFMIVEALEAGATGYITKSMPKRELFDAIDSVYRNIPYYCTTTSHKLARMIARSYFNPYNREKKGLFSESEKQIIRMICEDKSCLEMGDILCISPRTVENQRGKLYKKMNVKTTAGVAIYAIKHGLYYLKD